jgi:hypothetical protein
LWLLSSVDLSATTCTTSVLAISGSSGVNLRRVRVQNSNAAAGSSAVSTTKTMIVQECWFKATSTASLVYDSTSLVTAIGCVFEGGITSVSITNFNYGICVNCVFDSPTTYGISYLATTTSLFVAGCSFYNPGSDAIRLSAITTGFAQITNNIFSTVGGYAINVSTASLTTGVVWNAFNAFHSITSGNTNGLPESTGLGNQALSTSPFVNATGDDFSLVAGSAVVSAGAPGLLENQTYTSALDMGAVQRLPSAGNAGAIIGQGVRRSSLY